MAQDTFSFTRNYLLFAALLLSFLLPSCKSTELQLSLDVSNRRYKDKEYDESDGNKRSANFNMAMMIWMAGLGSHPAENVFINGGLDTREYLHHGGFEMNVLQNHLFPSESPAYTPAPTWMEELLLYTGIELLNRRSHEGLVKSNLTYLKVPAFLIHTEELEKGHVFGGLGPYLAYGIGGKTKLTFGGSTTKTKSFDSEEGFKRFDAGINWTAGYRFENSLIVRIAFDIGLVNIAQKESDYKEWNRTFGFNVSYPVSRIRERLHLN